MRELMVQIAAKGKAIVVCVFVWMVTAADKQVYECESEQVNETSFVKCFEELVLLKNNRLEKHYINASPNPVEGFPSKTWKLFALLSESVSIHTVGQDLLILFQGKSVSELHHDFVMISIQLSSLTFLLMFLSSLLLISIQMCDSFLLWIGLVYTSSIVWERK